MLLPPVVFRDIANKINWIHILRIQSVPLYAHVYTKLLIELDLKVGIQNGRSALLCI